MEFEQDLEIDKEVSNNIGDLFKKVKAESKQGKKLQEQNNRIEEGKIQIKKLTPGMDFNEAKNEYTKFLEIFYTGKALEKQMIFLDYKRTTEDIISTAWTILISRIGHYENNLKEFDELMENA